MSYKILEETDTEIVVIAGGVRITRKKQPAKDFLDMEADSIIAQTHRERLNPKGAKSASDSLNSSEMSRE